MILRDLREAGGTLAQAAVYSRLEDIGVPRDRTARAINHLAQTTGRVVRITRDNAPLLVVPTRYRDAA